MRASIASNARRLLDTGLGRHGSRRVLSATAAHSWMSLQAHRRTISSSRLLQRQSETNGPNQPHGLNTPKIPKVPPEQDEQPAPPVGPSVVVSGGGQFTTGSSAFDALLTTVCGVGMRECLIHFYFVPTKTLATPITIPSFVTSNFNSITFLYVLQLLGVKYENLFVIESWKLTVVSQYSSAALHMYHGTRPTCWTR